MKIDRLMGITMILLEKDIISAKELAEIFEVSIRTIYRDIDSIELAGVPIITTSGVNGGISILDNYKVDKNLFSNTELTNLFIGLNTITPIIDGKDNKILLSKLKNIIPDDKLNYISDLSNMIAIDLKPWKPDEFNQIEMLEEIKQAITNKNIINFEYSSNDKFTKRKVEPYQLVLKQGSWYLYAYCLLRNDFRLFKITRISNLRLLDKEFVIRKFEPFLERDNFKEKVIYLKLVVDKSLKNEMIEHCGHDNFKEWNNKLIVKYPFIEKEYPYAILLGYGSKCEIIEPEYIRNEIVGRINRMYEIYNK